MPSGLVIRATGDVTVTGSIVVDTGAMDSGSGAAAPHIARSAAGEPEALQATMCRCEDRWPFGWRWAQGNVRVPAGGAILALGSAGGICSNSAPESMRGLAISPQTAPNSVDGSRARSGGETIFCSTESACFATRANCTNNE